MKIKYKSIGSGTDEDPIRIDLPCYRILKQLSSNTFLIEVPDEFCTVGKIDTSKIRKLYDYDEKELSHLTEKEKEKAMSWKSKDYKDQV